MTQDVLRLATWKQLDRPEITPAPADAYRSKFDEIAEAQRAGRITPTVAPVDL
jgi:hypothetical protein